MVSKTSIRPYFSGGTLLDLWLDLRKPNHLPSFMTRYPRHGILPNTIKIGQVNQSPKRKPESRLPFPSMVSVCLLLFVFVKGFDKLLSSLIPAHVGMRISIQQLSDLLGCPRKVVNGCKMGPRKVVNGCKMGCSPNILHL